MTTHPRDRFDLQPSPEAELAFEDARLRGRLHHAWLLCGPEGVGKASFAYRAARRLLGAMPDPSRGPLGSRPDDPVSRLISAQSHPDLLVLERLVENGKTKKSISVDQARDLPEFFSKSPSQAQARVAIIDAADDLNINAANALLKILEEPPEHGVLLMVTHAPGRLLATIRSRCRRLAFPVWSQQALEDLVMDRSDVDAGEAERIAAMAGGSPGVALSLTSGATSEADRLVRRWVSEPVIDRAEALANRRRLSRRRGTGAIRHGAGPADRGGESRGPETADGAGGALGRTLGASQRTAGPDGGPEPRPGRCAGRRAGGRRQDAQDGRTMIIDSHVNLHAPSSTRIATPSSTAPAPRGCS